MRRFQGMSLVVLLVVAGCGGGEELPKTYPVTGTAYDPAGNPMTQGQVYFKHPTDTTLTVSGTIGKTGSFTLTTLKGNRKFDGAPEGDYQVTVMPGVPKGQHAAAGVLILPQTIHVEPKENTFDLRPSKPQ